LKTLNKSSINDIFCKTNLKHFLQNDLILLFENNFDKTLRFSDYINLRNPVRNSIVTHNAIQKVFRARFDEGRSNMKLLDYSNSHSTQLYISTPRFKYEKLLSKNKESYFNINFFKNQNIYPLNNFYDVLTSLNFYTYDFPFLLALKSDASRYL